MKKLLVSLFVASIASGCVNNGEFTINGQIGTLNAPAKAYLVYLANGEEVLDSVILSEGAFVFKGKITEPTMARVILDHRGEGLSNLSSNSDNEVVYLEGATIKLTGKDSVKNAVIKGSELNDENADYRKFIQEPIEEIKALNQEISNVSDEKREDEDFNAAMQSSYNKSVEKLNKLQDKFIKDNPGSFISLIALLEKTADREIDVEKIGPQFDALSATLRKTQVGKELGAAIKLARRTAVGSIAPDFTLNDPNNNPVKLSGFRGKYVLLDFWASWCGPCRVENPNIVSAYNKYKDKGFTVLGVSLDQPGKREQWLDAIAKDGLEWTQVSDLKFWNSEAAQLYGINSIPQNFLIDPSGKIIASNLRGQDLQIKLASLLK